MPPAISTKSGVLGARRESKTVTLDGNAGTGATGIIALFTVSGICFIHAILARATTDLVSGGGGSISLGTTNQVAAFIAATVATAIDTGEIWTTTTPTTGAADSPDIMTNFQVSENIIATVTTAAITAGVLEVTVLWEPVSPGSSLVAA